MLVFPNSFFQHVSQGHCSGLATVMPVGGANPVSGSIRSNGVPDVKITLRVLKPQTSFLPWLETSLHIEELWLGVALFQWITDSGFSLVNLIFSCQFPLVIMFPKGLGQDEAMGQGPSSAPSFSESPALPVHFPVLSFAVFRILSPFRISQEGSPIKALDISGLNIVNCDIPDISLDLLAYWILLTAVPKILWSPIGIRFLCLLFPWVLHLCNDNGTEMGQEQSPGAQWSRVLKVKTEQHLIITYIFLTLNFNLFLVSLIIFVSFHPLIITKEDSLESSLS